MIIAEKEFLLNGKRIVLRTARTDEALMLINYLETVCGETRFLMCESDEMTFTEAEEASFINAHNQSKDSMLLLAFVDGEYAGNCSFDRKGGGRRAKHRAGIGIALFQKFTGFGLGRLMLQYLIEKIKEQGFEQVELTVVSDNYKAYNLYESLGFRECGRIPNANKYDDGTYSEDILMVMSL